MFTRIPLDTTGERFIFQASFTGSGPTKAAQLEKIAAILAYEPGQTFDKMIFRTLHTAPGLSYSFLIHLPNQNEFALLTPPAVNTLEQPESNAFLVDVDSVLTPYREIKLDQIALQTIEIFNVGAGPTGGTWPECTCIIDLIKKRG